MMDTDEQNHHPNLVHLPCFLGPPPPGFEQALHPVTVEHGLVVDRVWLLHTDWIAFQECANTGRLVILSNQDTGEEVALTNLQRLHS